jgi:Na+/H+ antiporter NhaD/arsenite permease-like protein
MDWLVLVTFILVYLGMILGGLPGLALDRAGLALLGALLLIITGRLDLSQAWAAVDLPTLALLFGLMIVSAQLRLGGFYTRLTRGMAAAPLGPRRLLAVLILIAAALSALLVNDIVCLAMAPILVEGCTRRALNPRPYLLALACAANIGSAATLIGNPQNILIGQALQLSFVGYLAIAAVPVALGLAATWWIIARGYRGCWHLELPAGAVPAPPFSPWQTGKGLLVLALVTGAFLGTPWPRELVVLAAAALLLTSRNTASGRLLALVDWQLLLLFMGLFVINQALAATGLPTRLLADLAERGWHIGQPHWLFLLTAGLSNLVSNVPAVMLLLPAAGHPLAGPILALSSTLAGNLLVVGSIANIIVVDQAARLGTPIGWRDHARIGIPVTLLSLACCAAWLWLVMHFSGNG